MSTRHRSSQFANPAICPCHGSAPHVYVPKATEAKRAPSAKKPRKTGARKGRS